MSEVRPDLRLLNVQGVKGLTLVPETGEVQMYYSDGAIATYTEGKIARVLLGYEKADEKLSALPTT